MDKRRSTATPKEKKRLIFADNSNNVYVGGVGVSFNTKKLVCSFPILLCWFEMFALQNLQVFSKYEVTNVNVCT